jgi:hypothetical protein
MVSGTRRNFRVETLISIRFIAHLPSQSSATAQSQLGSTNSWPARSRGPRPSVPKDDVGARRIFLSYRSRAAADAALQEVKAQGLTLEAASKATWACIPRVPPSRHPARIVDRVLRCFTTISVPLRPRGCVTSAQERAHSAALAATVRAKGVDGLLKDATRPPPSSVHKIWVAGRKPLTTRKIKQVVHLTLNEKPPDASTGANARWRRGLESRTGSSRI